MFRKLLSNPNTSRLFSGKQIAKGLTTAATAAAFASVQSSPAGTQSTSTSFDPSFAKMNLAFQFANSNDLKKIEEAAALAYTQSNKLHCILDSFEAVCKFKLAVQETEKLAFVDKLNKIIPILKSALDYDPDNETVKNNLAVVECLSGNEKFGPLKIKVIEWQPTELFGPVYASLKANNTPANAFALKLLDKLKLEWDSEKSENNEPTPQPVPKFMTKR